MKFGENQSAMRTVAARALLLSAVAALTLAPLLPVVAAESEKDPVTTSAIGPVKMRFLSLGIGKSVVVDLPRDVKDVLVADPKIANAVVRSSQRAYIIGGAVGQTNVVFFDADGQQVASYDIAVKRDLNGVRAALRQSLPGIQIEGVGDSVLLTGSVSSPVEAQQAGEIAARLVGGADKVVNSIVVRGRDQVMLKVTVAEVRRDIVKQMGVDLSASMNYGTAAVNFNNSNPFTANSAPLVPGNGLGMAALNKARLPSVTGDAARDGKRRRREDAGRTQSDGDLRRIRDIYLRRRISHSDRRDLPNDDGGRDRTMRPDSQLQEIRHLAQLHAGRADRGTDQPAGDDRSVGSLDRKLSDWRRRRNDDSLDQDPPRRNDAGNSLRRLDGDGRPDPGADQAGHQRPARRSTRLPVLGALFRSQDFVNNQTELMVIVTPYVVRAVAQKELSRPDDGFAPASDSQSDAARAHQPDLRASPPASIPSAESRAISASSLIETQSCSPSGDEDRTMTTRIPLHRVKALRMLGALLGLSAALGACTPQTTEVVDRQRVR